MYYYNPIDGTIHKGECPSLYYTGGNVVYDLLINDPPYSLDICTLTNPTVKNSDNTYGAWILDVAKAKAKQIQYIKEMWEREFTLPLSTPYGIYVQQQQLDLNNFRDGILNAVMTYANTNQSEFTADELANLSIGTLTASAYEKCKNNIMIIRDYYNNLHEVTLEVARNIALIQAAAIAASYTKKWTLQDAIDKLPDNTTYNVIISYSW
jgi:hypothetical protein